MQVSIIILNYNTPLDTVTCIGSLFTHYKKEFDSKTYEIILVDNKSTDESVHKIEREIKKRNWKLLFIKSDKNAGFGGGCNTGAKKAKGKYILFLNSDTIVKNKSIQKMVDFLDNHPEASIVGGGMVNRDGSMQAGCGVFPNFYHSIMMFLGVGKDILITMPKSITTVDWVTGGCMLVSKKIFDEIKGFDENIFMYFEDLDICYRAGMRGRSIYYFPGTKIIHLHGKSSTSSFGITHGYKGYLYFYKRHKNKLEFMCIDTLFRLKFMLYSIFGKLTNNIELTNTYSRI